MRKRTMSVPRRSLSVPRTGTMNIPRSGTINTVGSQAYSHATSRRTMHRGFGGFPMPHELFSRLIRRAFPQLERKLTRTITIPHTRTIASEHGLVPPGSRAVPYITFEAVVRRNSVFQGLTPDQLEELGGVEYRALTALLWIVAAVSAYVLSRNLPGQARAERLLLVPYRDPVDGLRRYRAVYVNSALAGRLRPSRSASSPLPYMVRYPVR